MKKYKIIIVENDEDEQFFMKEGFDGSGLFQIIAQVKNGNDLLDWLEQHPSVKPDIILSDLNMPGKNGYDVIADTRSLSGYSHIPVIIISTSSTKTIIDKCLASGAAGYLVKPDTFIEYSSFAKKLCDLIEKKELIR
jgi:CheY-like chemotaxis protein